MALVKEKAYAKLNLHLDIVGKRVDGFHDLEMIMAPVRLHDVLTFKKKTEPGIMLTSSKEITDKPEDNLVYAVASYMLETLDIDSGLEIHIEKNIPIAAGMAGGSADAAATLRGINKLFKLRISLERLAQIGERFGADVPYCVHNRLCIARGKGEKLFFLDRKLNIPVLLITPPIHVSTKAVFESVSTTEFKPVKITTMSNAIYNKNYELITSSLHNSLEPFSFRIFEEIGTLKEEIEAFGVDGVLMSGTGPTVFVIDKDKEKLHTLFEKYVDKHSVNLTRIK